MITIRHSNDRGHAQHGWLDSYHTFSFSNYYDPAHMGFRSLRVINEDRIAPGQGFGTHSHRDMEIITFVLDGAIAHKDSIGNTEVLRPGEIQRMTAGTGIAHSEFNPADDAPTHLLQIWILPDRQGLPPSYEQIAVPLAERSGRLKTIASPDGRDGGVKIHQDLLLLTAVLAPQQQIEYQLAGNRAVWLQITRGEVTLNGHTLVAGDGAAIDRQDRISLEAVTDSEILLFDMA